MIKDLTKKVAKIFGISFLGFYLPYLFLITIGFIFYDAGSQVGYIPIVILVGLVLLIVALIMTIVLLFFSLLDKRILNSWFVFGFSVYSICASILLDNSSFNSSFNQIFIILVPLLIVIVLINIKKWIKK